MTSFKTAFLILAAAFACAFAVVPGSSAQTRTPKGTSTPTPPPIANFIFDDGSGPADAGTYPVGASFTFSINLSFAPGGNVADLAGLSYWFEQQSPLAPFYFSITNRDATGSQFTFFQTLGLTYPQSLTPQNPSDLGASTAQSGSGLGAGTYFIANLTIKIDPSAAPGTYIIENTTTPINKKSIISDSGGHTFGIAHTSYTVTVVPFNITSINPGDNQDIVLQCIGVPLQVNRIEASPDLSPNSFQTIGSVTPDSSGAFSFDDTNPGTQQFYRLAFP